MDATARESRAFPWLGPRAAYVHFPFCRTKCLYCDFNTYAGKERLTGEYGAALVREVERRGAEGAGPLRSVYFGGGTPSLMPLPALRRVMAALVRTFGVDAGAEVTLEANPGTFGRRTAAAWRSAGITRVSLGVQSLDDETLRRLARTHDAAQALDAVATVRAAGLRSASLDLIYGLPWQTLDGWRRHLSRALDAGPDHVSLYALMVENGTPLQGLVARGAWQVPDDDLVADMYEASLPLLAAGGFVHYEVSNWARPGHESRHNRVYWRNEAYLGFGAGAHSYVDGRRSWNLKPIEGYIRSIGRHESPTAGDERLEGARSAGETAALALRMRHEGLDVARFRERFGLDPLQRWGGEIAALREGGLMEVDGGRLTLTDAGLLVSSEIGSRFL